MGAAAGGAAFLGDCGIAVAVVVDVAANEVEGHTGERALQLWQLAGCSVVDDGFVDFKADGVGILAEIVAPGAVENESGCSWFHNSSLGWDFGDGFEVEFVYVFLFDFDESVSECDAKDVDFLEAVDNTVEEPGFENEGRGGSFVVVAEAASGV